LALILNEINITDALISASVVLFCYHSKYLLWIGVM